MKPLLRRATGASNGNRYDHYHDSPHPKTYGSGHPSRPRRSILTTIGTRSNDEGFEMIKSHRARGRLSASDHDRNITVYGASGDRAGSEELILAGGADDPKRIKCTTELVINNVKIDN
jgi:hypothetical protein